ncbi:hypothetical protein [Salipaludibacillus daqingensis]|uniref:hypothetical protein n=1 Tax=Salipaludibacillus daqingensis TaxID=3041001 RepID=UPI0024742751|nr:hypothetical protein [Salipaludibacillus daqingensis]
MSVQYMTKKYKNTTLLNWTNIGTIGLQARNKGEKPIMMPIKHSAEEFMKEYSIEMNNVLYPILSPDKGKYYKEVNIEDLDIKWLRLPSENELASLQKLFIENKGSKTIELKVHIHYNILANHPIPFVYYSPSSEAMMLCRKTEYCLIGGTTPKSGPFQYQTNEKDMLLSTGVHSDRSVFPPISQESKGCGLSYNVKVEANKSVFLYDWEINHANLYELETTHDYFKDLFTEKSYN